jgi:hypothetical protein
VILLYLLGFVMSWLMIGAATEGDADVWTSWRIWASLVFWPVLALALVGLGIRLLLGDWGRWWRERGPVSRNPRYDPIARYEEEWEL